MERDAQSLASLLLCHKRVSSRENTRDVNMEADVQVIFENWLYKLPDVSSSGKRKFRLSSSWKKRYFILLHENEKAFLCYYDKKPRTVDDKPKGKIPLFPSYKIEKKYNVNGKPWVCEITTPTTQVLVAAEDEKLYHLLTFFLQAQSQLRDELEDDCFVVRPDTSGDHEKIGAKGNMCLMHVSKWGIILSLQLSKCVLAIWPLRSIKFYESSGRGQFALETGKKAPMGLGKYSFNTRIGQDNLIYDILEKFVNEAAGLNQMVSARESNPPNLESAPVQYSKLQEFTYAHSDARFLSHLKKLSRGIYDQLSEHLGAGTSTRLNASSPDLLSDSPHMSGHSLPRSASSQAVNITPSNSARRKKAIATNKQFTKPESVTSPSNISVLSIDSQYLHTSLPNDPRISGASTIAERYVNGGATNANPHDYSNTARGLFDHRGSRVSQISTVSTLTEEVEAAESRVFTRHRLHSRSCEDLTDYTRMSLGNGLFTYDNETFKASDETIDPRSTDPSSGVYSYARPIDEWQKSSFSSGSYVTGSPMSDRFAQSPESRGAVFSISPAKSSPTKSLQVPPVFYNRSYLNRPGRLRKSMSNPDLLERELRMPYPGFPKARRPTHLDLPTPPPVPKPPMLRRIENPHRPHLDFSKLNQSQSSQLHQQQQQQQQHQQHQQPHLTTGFNHSSSYPGYAATRRSTSPVSMISRQSYDSTASGESMSAVSRTSATQPLSPSGMMKGITFTNKTKSFVKSPPVASITPQQRPNLHTSNSTPEVTRGFATNERAGLSPPHRLSNPSADTSGVMETLC